MLIQPSLAKYADQDHDSAIADLIDPERLIALRPIAIVGPLAFYWSLGKKDSVIRRCGVRFVMTDRFVMTPRVRWIGRAAKTLIRSIHNQGEPR